jgi:uncharacterized membrane protein (Fun14 family)
MITSEILVILNFFLIVLIGIAIVSIHYRSKYEEMKIKYEKLKAMVNKHIESIEELE